MLEICHSFYSYLLMPLKPTNYDPGRYHTIDVVTSFLLCRANLQTGQFYRTHRPGSWVVTAFYSIDLSVGSHLILKIYRDDKLYSAILRIWLHVDQCSLYRCILPQCVRFHSQFGNTIQVREAFVLLWRAHFFVVLYTHDRKEREKIAWNSIYIYIYGWILLTHGKICIYYSNFIDATY